MKKGSDPFSAAARELARYATLFYHRGWMPGTSGNLSLKVASRPLTLVITPSGVDKGELTPRDILTVAKGARGARPPWHQRLRPSAETAIHFALYEAFPTTGAVFHVHTVHSTLVATHLSMPVSKGVPRSGATRYVRQGAVRMRGLEMLKGFETLAPKAAPQIPVFPNIDDLEEFGDHVKRHAARLKQVPGFLIAHHGMTCWGRTGQQAEKHLELMDFLCHYLWECQRR